MPYPSTRYARKGYTRSNYTKPVEQTGPSVVVISFNKDISVAMGERIATKRKLPDMSPQQANIIDTFRNTEQNGMIIARAGCGKSTTLEMLIQATGFANIQSKTGHSVGFGILASYRRKVSNGKLTVLKELYEKTLLCLPPTKSKSNPDGMEYATQATIGNIVSKCKGLMIDPNDTVALYNLCATYNIDIDPEIEEEVFEWVPIVMQKSLDMIVNNGWIDFDDMVYGPVALNLAQYATKYAVVLGDEGQDFNEAQRRLLEMISDRLWIVGDPKQAIYGFRGAMTAAMAEIAEHLEHTERGLATLPLTVTRRCPLVITALAREIVPDIECPDDAPDGTVCIGNGRMVSDWVQRGGQSEYKYALKFVAYTDEEQTAHDAELPGLGDWIVCRTNAPLYKMWLSLIKDNTPATILGRRDEAKSFKKFITRMGGPEVQDMLEGLAEHVDVELRKLSALNNNGKADAAIETLMDKSDCVITLSEGCKTIDEIFARIDAMFENVKRPEQRVTLSSVHRAKGGEAKVIRIIYPELLCKFGTQKWEKEQEQNIKYVAITRSLSILHIH